MPSQAELIEAYGVMSDSLIEKAGNAAEKAFYALPNYSGFDIMMQYVEQYESILFPARMQAASMAAGFHSEIAKINGKKFTMPKLRPEDFRPWNLRNVDQAFGAYQSRPFREVYRHLSKSNVTSHSASPGTLTEAIAQGGYRAKILAQTDVQLARRKASLFAREANDNIVGYIRVLTGAESCGLCYIASTQRYNKNDLSPIHPGCDCGELPIYGDSDPGQIVDQYNLDRIHESFDRRFGSGTDLGARDLGIGKAVEYKDGVRLADYTLISIRENSELGPVLTRRQDKFLTLAEIQERIRLRKIAGTPADPSFGFDISEAGLRSSARQLKARINAAKHPMKVNEILREGLGITVRDELNLTGDDFNLEAYKEFTSKLIDLQEQYPTPLAELELRTRMDAYAYVYTDKPQGVMGVTNEVLDAKKDKATIRKQFQKAQDSGFFGNWILDAGVEPVEYIQAHEYGHLLDNFGGRGFKPRSIARRFALEGVTEDDLKQWTKDNISLSSFWIDSDNNWIDGSSLAYVERNYIDAYVTEKISEYAVDGKNPRAETVAEAFAQVYFRGDKAEPVAKAITDRMLESYREAAEKSGLEAARRVTDKEIAEVASDVLQSLPPSQRDSSALGDVSPDVVSLISSAIQATGLLAKKKTLAGNAIGYVTSEIAQAQVVARVRAAIVAQAQAAKAGAK